MEYMLIQVCEDLVPLLSNVASSIFVDYYTDLIGKAQAEYMADMFLSEENLLKEINNGAVCKLMFVNGIPVGFTEYKLDDDRVFLSKLYLHATFRGKKLGRELLNDVIKYTKDNNRSKIYLTCNKYNPTLKKYLKMGFKQIDDVVSDIGQGYVMDDYIMELDIQNEKAD